MDIEARMNALATGQKKNIRMNTLMDQAHLYWHENKPVREGFHASAMLANFEGVGQFCYKEQILGQHFLPVPEKLTASQARIFTEGWYVHTKWQSLWQRIGWAVEIEHTRIDPRWHIHHTPDGILRLPQVSKDIPADTLWIAEIKSINDRAYNAYILKEEPPAVYNLQLQFYLYLTGIEWGFVLIENKNNQQHYEWCVRADHSLIEPYIPRLDNLTKMNTMYKETARLPKMIEPCVNGDNGRMHRCPYRHVCTVSKVERLPYARTQEEQERLRRAGQQNASPMHTSNEEAS